MRCTELQAFRIAGVEKTFRERGIVNGFEKVRFTSAISPIKDIDAVTERQFRISMTAEILDMNREEFQAQFVNLYIDSYRHDEHQKVIFFIAMRLDNRSARWRAELKFYFFRLNVRESILDKLRVESNEQIFVFKFT